MKNPELFKVKHWMPQIGADAPITLLGGTDITLRDLFAAAALTGQIIADASACDNADKAAAWAYEHADAMLAERSEE